MSTKQRIERLEVLMEKLRVEYCEMVWDDVSRCGTSEEKKNRDDMGKHQEKYRLLTGHYYRFGRRK